jgi:hypothetical protein
MKDSILDSAGFESEIFKEARFGIANAIKVKELKLSLCLINKC